MNKASANGRSEKEKPQKLCLANNKARPIEDRNANNAECGNSPTFVAKPIGGTISKTVKKNPSSNNSKKCHRSSTNVKTKTLIRDENYMEFEFFNKENCTEPTKLFGNLTVPYRTINEAGNIACNDTPPPIPPPISELPSRSLINQRNNESSVFSLSCPSTPSRGKVVLSKKERKELTKLEKLKYRNTGSVRSLITPDSAGCHSAQTSPYKGRVMELKNCIARINSKVLFASLNRTSQKSLNSQNITEQEKNSTNEVSSPPPTPHQSSLSSNACNNNELDYTEKLKNLPVRPRKAHFSHMDNYCLFDPMDFANEKTSRKAKNEKTLTMHLACQMQTHNLNDQLFSSHQYLCIKEGAENIIHEADTNKLKEQVQNFEHHNYFVINPDDMEDDPSLDICIPNQFTNEEIMKMRLLAAQHDYVNNIENLKYSASLQNFTDVLDVSDQTSNSQDDKGNSTKTPVALLESSTSINSSSSTSNSNVSTHMSMQNCNKKITFLNPSACRVQKSDSLSPISHDGNISVGTSKNQERSISELLSDDHMSHLQEMLLSASSARANRSHTIPIESNYALFNPCSVKTRNMQYKIRKPRPLSTHSDADSGFLSPCSAADEFSRVKFNPAILVLQQCDSVQGYIEIYTDWANYYLERTKSEKKVTDLSSDCRDGLLLSEIIEAVTSFKVLDLYKKPKNLQQMHDNVNSCLNILRSHSVAGVDSIDANDICCGRLKALFLALSRYKQQSKQLKYVENTTSTVANNKNDNQQQSQPIITTRIINNSGAAVKVNSSKSRYANVVARSIQQQQQSLQNDIDATLVSRDIPTGYSEANGTAIHLQGTVIVQGRCPPDKIRPLPPTPNHTPCKAGLGKSANELSNSRPNSPSRLKFGNNNGLRPPYVKACKTSCVTTPAINNVMTQKNSSLDKFKLFNRHNQQEEFQSVSTLINKHRTTSKRTSSSTGFSTHRSERSDSTLSLNEGLVSQVKPLPINTTSANKGRDSKTNTKQPKQSIAQSKKGLMKNSSKAKKIEKSPARCSHREESGLDTESFALNRVKQSSSRNDKESPNNKSNLNSKSQTKTLLNTPTVNKSLMSSTVLPKPIAAIKGTCKLLQDDTQPENKACAPNPNLGEFDISNSINDISYPQKTTSSQPPTYIVKPVLIISEKDAKTNVHSNAQMTTLNNNNIEGSSIMKPTQEALYNRFVPPKIAFDTPSNIRKLKCNIGPIVLSSRIKTHSQPVTPTTSNNIKYQNFITTKFHTVPSSVTTIYEEDKPINILPMRPLLKGYNSHVTLPTRTNNGSHHFLAHFTDNSLQEGYCSDGGKSIHLNKGLSTLPLGNQEGFHDFDNGYLSEGNNGAGLTQCTSPINRRGKHFLSVIRVHTQLPTTIEEGISNSRCSSDSLGTTVTSSAASQASSSGSSIPKMNTGKSCNNDNSSNNSTHSSPQYQHNTSYRSASRQINNRDNWSKMPEQLNGHKIEHKEQKFSLSRRSSNGGITSTSNKQGSQSGRTKGVPPRFGYTKRSNGASTSTAEQQNITLMLNSINNLQNSRTGHVSTVHQTHTDGNGRRKVTGGTQTLPNDVTRVPPHTQYRSYSLTGPGATQLSQSIRERLSTGSHSLPKPGNDIYQERSIKSEKMYPPLLTRGTDLEIEPYYCLPVESAQNNAMSAQMAGGVASNSHNFINDATVSWSQPTSPTPFNRVFANTMTPTHANTAVGISNITSLAAGSSSGTHKLTYPKKNDDVHGSAASLLSGGSSLYGTSEERQAHEIRRLKRELIEAREQVLSLSTQLSTNAHVVAAFEQSLFNMTTRLQQLTVTAERKDSELTDLRQTIELLRKQSIQAGLTTAHMQSMGVQTQSQSQNYLLSNKPPPLSATLAPAAQSLSHQSPKVTTANGHSIALQRHHSSGSMCSVNSIRSVCSAHDKTKKKKGWLRSSFTKAFSRNTKMSKTNRHVEQHPPNNTNALDSNMLQPNESIHGTPVNHQPRAETPRLAALAAQPTALCSSINASDKTVTIIDDAKPIDAIDQEDKNHEIVEDLKKQLREKDLVLTDIRLEALSSASQLESLKETLNKMRAEMMSLKQNNERLQKIVTSRSLACSEASLGNATSPNSSIAETRRYSLADSSTRPPMELPKRLDEEVEEENILPAPGPEPPPPPLSPSTHIDLTPPTALEPIPSPIHINTDSENLPDVNDGKKIAISVYLGQPESFHKYCEELLEADEYYTNSPIINSIMAENGERKTFSTPGPNEFVIAYTYISGKTTWQNLDYIVRKTFKDYVSRIDPGTNLGLNTDSITSYHLGEAKRGPEMGFPELLPCGYIIGSVRTLYVCLQGVGSLAFDSLIHRSIVHRYISLLAEHRRLILCGPSGTGKSYLARRLAEFLVARIGIRGNSPSEAIATFNVDHKSSKELRQYLGHIAEQTAIASGTSELPSVIILDNLHHASALTDVFSCLLSAGPAAKLPCIIGTISQATCNTTNLQLHHNFRWVLTANHMEPVKGFLGRFLRRRLFQLELQSENPQPDLTTVLAWLPTVWQHINRFLEAHSSSDVTIGPRLFLSCPLDLKESQLWFTDIWNYHLSPYLIEAVREGVQLYGRRGGTWNDPSVFIRNSYPWPYGPDSLPPLRQINAEDVGLEGISTSNEENQDPLLNMLMRLQEAANYSENLDPESDCVSLDSNVTPDSSADAE